MAADRSDAQRRVMITGVTRGLGLAMAEGFIAEGCRVAGCGRSASQIDRWRQDYRTPHRFDVVDISSDAEVRSWTEAVLSTLGTPDLLINNAAIINANNRLWEVPVAEFDQVVDINIKGVVNTIRHVVPAMVQRGEGVIVNFSSYWGRSTSPEVAPYCATKFAIEGLTQALAQDLPPGLAAVALNPGIIDTQMLRSCFGPAAAHHPDPATWARPVVPFLLQLGPADNGQSLTAPTR